MYKYRDSYGCLQMTEMAEHPLISIVIVNWNSGCALAGCLDSIDLYADGGVLETIVVDNDSQDASALACSEHPSVRLMQLDANLGFGAACNLGAQKLAGEWILFLNPDARLMPNTLKELMRRVAEAPEEMGIHGVQIVDDHNHVSRTCARLPTAAQFFMHALGVDRLFPRLGFQMLEWDHSASGAVDHVMGSFYLVRKKLFEVLGGFDEQFFVYMEDLDFSLRAKKKGFHCYFWSDLQVYHEGGGCSKNVRALRLFYDLRSRWIFARKHFSTYGRTIVYAAMLVMEPCSRSLYAIARFSGSDLRESIDAQNMLLRWLLRGGKQP